MFCSAFVSSNSCTAVHTIPSDLHKIHHAHPQTSYQIWIISLDFSQTCDTCAVYFICKFGTASINCPCCYLLQTLEKKARLPAAKPLPRTEVMFGDLHLSTGSRFAFFPASVIGVKCLDGRFVVFLCCLLKVAHLKCINPKQQNCERNAK